MARPVKQAAVLYTGVVGAHIAAHFANAGIPTLLFGLTHADQPNAEAERALDCRSWSLVRWPFRA
jgi:3-hydroxyacyl-CoA dehydrogenase